MAADPDYDAMDDEAEAETEEVDAEDGELDDEFLMLAEKLGFEGEKAETFKQAIERCVELKNGGGYAEEPLDLEEPLV